MPGDPSSPAETWTIHMVHDRSKSTWRAKMVMKTVGQIKKEGDGKLD